MSESDERRDRYWRVLGVLASIALGIGAFGAMLEAPLVSIPFGQGFRLFFLGSAVVAAGAFLLGGELLGALIGTAASAVSGLLLFSLSRVLAADGLGVRAHFGWGFALTVPAGALFVATFVWAARR